MGEFDLSWGRAGMCLSLIREGKGVMSVVRAVQDSHDVHRVRANLGKECKICFQSVSIYEVGFHSNWNSRFFIRWSVSTRLIKSGCVSCNCTCFFAGVLLR